ncbi:ATP-binding protein [Thermosulfurimonas dismutans]|uniref:Putative ATP-dependent endonuclease, OLD family n=1 Tax=Thermosulfurimonas dismutans TaxID=999894 RepID=A0A179D4J0_9BACT|nr:AAA family ATPase [Thermosulfurimonas dismutans]OAQ20639.1 putative ATP-dependent endonuclease, OLD family [Thermosulfurimonas dismutans]
MKIAKVILEDFRAFKGKVVIPLDDFTAFIGKNDQGKSSILEAIDIFLNDGKGVVKTNHEDINVHARAEGKNSFKIGIVFKNFPQELIIDERYPTNLKNEFLLNEDELLEVWKTFTFSGRLKVVTTIACIHPVNDNFLKDLLRKKRRELQQFVNDNSILCSNRNINAILRESIRKFYKQKDGNLKLEKIEIQVDAEDAKAIWEKLKNYLPIYGLFHSDRKNLDQDAEIQDPLKIAVERIFKDDEEIKEQLLKIAEKVENQIKSIAESTIQQFKKLAKQETKIEPDIPSAVDLKWKDVYKGIGFKTDDGVPLNKRGSGFRRLVLLSFFISEKEKRKEESTFHVIYAIEEPETSLHPDLQRILLDSLLGLANSDIYQVLITTHSPSFIRLLPTDSIKYIEKENNSVSVAIFDENILSKIIQNLGIMPTIGKVIWCVEGETDEKFLININQNIPELKEIIDLSVYINSGVLAFNIMGGSQLKNHIDRHIFRNTNAIEFHLYDRDEDEKYKNEIEKVKQRKDGSNGLLTKKREIENYIPQKLIETELNIILGNISDWDNADIPKLVANKKGIKEKDAKKLLCGKVAQKITKSHLEELNAWEEIKNWFEIVKGMCNKVI